MEPSGDAPRRAASPAGELIVQNGRHAGSRCSLPGALTVIGRAPGCDLRLTGEGIDPIHCLLALTPQGLVVRDLNSAAGILVNGARTASASLQEGDVLAIGPVQLRVHRIAAAEAVDVGPQRDALRVQAAAVAAQQIALEEEERRLQEQQAALEQHEQQLAAHLEEKRRKLVEVSERVQAERVALAHDRQAYEQQVQKITGDLTANQREVMEGKQRIQEERRRVSSLHKRLRQRWHRFWLAERRKTAAQREELLEQAQLLQIRAGDLQRHEQKLLAQRLRFNALYELGRRHLQEAWNKLSQDRRRWKHRRGCERLALKVRARDVDQHARRLVEAQQLLVRDKTAWDARKKDLQEELAGLDQRARNQWQILQDQRSALACLEQEIAARSTQMAVAPEVPLATSGSVPSDAAPAGDGAPVPAVVTSLSAPQTPANAVSGKKAIARQAAAELAHERARLEAVHEQRLAEVQRLADDLADQRLLVVEQWQRLVLVHQHWEDERRHSAAELEEVAHSLTAHGASLTEKETAQENLELALRQRHEELVQLRQQMIAWRARLRAREHASEGERGNLLAEVRQREALAEQQLTVLVDLRQRWARRRKEEVDRIRARHASLEEAQSALAGQRLELAQRSASLDDEKRLLTERALALEEFRKEVLPREDQARAERRLERHRRRWVAQHATSLRGLARERDGLKEELKSLQALGAQVQQRAADLAAAEADLTERLGAWEHKQSLAQSRQTRLQEELHLAAAQRALTEQQLAKLKDEIERIARSLYDEPDPPSLSLERAA